MGDIFQPPGLAAILLSCSISTLCQSPHKMLTFASPDCMDKVLANPKLCDLTFTANQVLAVLSSLDVNKASGPDEIPARILKETAHKIDPSLGDLFNKLLSLCSFPTEWKLANIVPVYKKDNKEYVKNYQPISLLCLVSKVMEHCLMLLRIKYIAWSAAAIANIPSWQSVRALCNWLRCLTLLIPSCARGDELTLSV